MAVTESTGTSLSTAYFKRNFYKNNKNAMKSSTRVTYTSDEKSFEDSRALRRAVKRLGSYSYDDESNRETIASTITAFVEVYNNTVTSSADSSDHDVARYSKKLKKLSEQYSDAFDKMGITVEKDGTLTIRDEESLKDRDIESLKTLFDGESDFLQDLSSLSRKLESRSHTNLYEQLTGNGTLLNISI